MKKPWERPREPEEPEGPQEPEEVVPSLLAQSRAFRLVFFFMFAPAVGIGCVWVVWTAALSGRPMPTNPLFFVLAAAGPAALWFAAVRLVLAAKLLGDYELRTEEEDTRQQRLFQQYIQPGGVLDWAGLLISLVHLAIVVNVF